jgi:hypothetical protein
MISRDAALLRQLYAVTTHYKLSIAYPEFEEMKTAFVVAGAFAGRIFAVVCRTCFVTLSAVVLAIPTATVPSRAKDNAIYKILGAPMEEMGYREIPPLPENIKMLYLTLHSNGKIMGLIPNTNLWFKYKAKGTWSGFMLDWQISGKDWGWASTSKPKVPVHLPNGQIIYPDSQ